MLLHLNSDNGLLRSPPTNLFVLSAMGTIHNKVITRGWGVVVIATEKKADEIGGAQEAQEFRNFQTNVYPSLQDAITCKDDELSYNLHTKPRFHAVSKAQTKSRSAFVSAFPHGPRFGSQVRVVPSGRCPCGFADTPEVKSILRWIWLAENALCTVEKKKSSVYRLLSLEIQCQGSFWTTYPIFI